MKKAINIEAGTITFTFEGLEPIVFNPSAMHEANRTYAMLHGMAARLGDNAAITKSAENGFKVTEGMRREAVMELVEHYLSGSPEWSPRAKGEGRKASLNPAIAQLATKLGKSYAEAEAWFNARLMAELTGDAGEEMPGNGAA